MSSHAVKLDLLHHMGRACLRPSSQLRFEVGSRVNTLLYTFYAFNKSQVHRVGILSPYACTCHGGIEC
jgi:hypothetical protein